MSAHLEQVDWRHMCPPTSSLTQFLNTVPEHGAHAGDNGDNGPLLH